MNNVCENCKNLVSMERVPWKTGVYTVQCKELGRFTAALGSDCGSRSTALPIEILARRFKNSESIQE